MSEQRGILKVVLPIETGTSKNGNTWSKQSFVVGWTEEKSGYSKILAFDTMNEKCQDFLRGLRIGTEVNVKYNIESREYAGKYYTNCTAWSISSVAGGITPPLDTTTSQEPKSVSADNSGDSSLPF